MNYRHGDIALIKIDKLPEDLKPSKNNIIIENGSGGNPHSFNGKGILYKKSIDNFIIGYIKAEKGASINHIEHKEMMIKIGVYEIRRQQEFTPEGMRPVID